jgi:hypothetical protein
LRTVCEALSKRLRSRAEEIVTFPEEKHLFCEQFPKEGMFFPKKTSRNDLLSKLPEGMLVFPEEKDL